jgi:hypothetical protein
MFTNRAGKRRGFVLCTKLHGIVTKMRILDGSVAKAEKADIMGLSHRKGALYG